MFDRVLNTPLNNGEWHQLYYVQAQKSHHLFKTFEKIQRVLPVINIDLI